MDQKAMSEALNAIHDEAIKLLKQSRSKKVQEGLELIISLARYKNDVRTRQEKVKQ